MLSFQKKIGFFLLLSFFLLNSYLSWRVPYDVDDGIDRVPPRDKKVQVLTSKDIEKMGRMQIVQGQIAYSLELYKQLVSVEHGNAAMSPLSISAALAMTAAGAEGETLNQLLSHLKFVDGNTVHQYFRHIRNKLLNDGSSQGGPTIEFANLLLVDKTLSLHPRYQHLVGEYYGAVSSAVDFATEAERARIQVNTWVSLKTRGKISDLLPPGSVTEDTRFLLSNSLYFKGQWEKKFDSSRTKNEPFFLLDGSTVKRPMMTSNESQYIRNHGRFKVLRLPYLNGNRGDRAFSMYILLPNRRGGLVDLEKHLDGTAPEWFMKHLPGLSHSVPVGKFLLPRFSVSCGFEGSRLLTSLGLKLPFDRERADFSPMLSEMPDSFPPLYISSVFHKATVEEDEEGTIATAATVVNMPAGSGFKNRGEPQDFVADHPFLFLIREDQSGIILFIGRVVDPK